MEIKNIGSGSTQVQAPAPRTVEGQGLKKPPTDKPSGLAATSQTNADNQQNTSTPLKESLETSVKEMNEFVKSLNNSLQFSLDEETGKTIVKVVDTTTDEVIKQIPSEEVLAMAKAIDKLKGLLIQQKA